MKKIINRVISLFLVIFTLINTIPLGLNRAYAEQTANSMGAAMINFFRQGQEDLNVMDVTASELRVYGVFISNFFLPGQTRVLDLSVENENDDELAKKVAKLFLQNEDKSNIVGDLNNQIFKAIEETAKESQLCDSEGVTLTGKSFLDAMTSTTETSKVYRKAENSSNKPVFLFDLKDPTVRGAFKILASLSPTYLLGGTNGVKSMDALYIDCFGNIWGGFNRIMGEETLSPFKNTLNLVLPACLNPISFLNTAPESNTSELKLPLNNAFAMGSMIDSKDILDTISSDAFAPYYNILNYLNEETVNSLNIYGITSPFEYAYDTDKINEISETNTTKEEIDKKINDFVDNDSFLEANNYKIVLTNRWSILSDDFNTLRLSFGEGYEEVEKVYNYYDYLFDPLALNIEDTNSDIYYFDVPGNITWNGSDTFLSNRILGVNMYGEVQRDANGNPIKDGKVYIYDKGQKATEILEILSKTDIDGLPEYSNFDDFSKLNILNLLIEKKHTIIADEYETIPFTNVVDKAKFRVDASKSIFNVKKLYIYGVSEKTDFFLHNGIEYAINPYLSELTEANKELRELVLFHTLHTYAISGANIPFEKVDIDNAKLKVLKGQEKTEVFYPIRNSRMSEANNWPGIFWGYMVHILDMERATREATEREQERADSLVETGQPTTKVQTQLDMVETQNDRLPEIPSHLVSAKSMDLNLSAEAGVANSSEKSFEATQKEIVQKIYGLLTDGPSSYRDSWLKNTLDGFLLSTHRAITGSWLGGIATVSTGDGNTYSSVVGYISTPSLYDLPFTSWLMNNYMQIYILGLLITLIFLILMVLLRMRTWQEGVILFVCMSIGLLIPNILIENTINIGNKVTDSIYSDRFDFWALTQHQQSIKKLNGANSYSTSVDDIVNNATAQAERTYSTDAGVRVKWMAPKKTDVFADLFTNKNVSRTLATNLTIFKWLFSSFIYEQEFVGSDPMATYLYRPYNAIAKEAEEYYIKGQLLIPLATDSKSLTMEYKNSMGDSQQYTVDTPSVIKNIMDKSKAYEDGKFNELFYAATLSDKNFFKSDNIFNIFWSTERVDDLTKVVGAFPNSLELSQRSPKLWGLNSDKVNNVIFSSGLTTERGKGVQLEDLNSEEGVDADLLAYYKNTESPFYFFYNTLKLRHGDNKAFKNALLDKEIFVVVDTENEIKSTSNNVNNTIRDFLDMEGLFTYIIPYMTVSNQYVYDWTSVNGTEVPEYDFGVGADIGDSSLTDEFSDVAKLKADMQNVWSMYCPWVDQLNSLDISNKKVSFGGSSVRIENTLNPSYYLKSGRPMIFSEAEMQVRGFTVKDLTDIELRIQRVLEETYRDMQYLVNYYDLEDDVLLSAAAMAATFNFNKEFSQTSFFGESVMLYPQSFEMKNFNYDAFMRLIMLNATGETVFAENDLYQRILQKTSFFTGILLLVSDILAVIVIPALKLVILLMLLFLGILICVSVCVSPPEKLLESIGKSIFLPSILFLGMNIIFAYIVSLLVGEGLTSYVGSKGASIVTNDPTITILILIVIDIIYSIGLFKILKMLIVNYKKFGIAAVVTGAGLVAGAIKYGSNRVPQLMRRGIGAVGSAIGGTVAGAAIAERGQKLSGALSGLSSGLRGENVYRDYKVRKRNAEENAKAFGVDPNFTNRINKLASGENPDDENKQESNDEKNGLQQVREERMKDKDRKRTWLGDKLENGVYKANATGNKIQSSKYALLNGAKAVVSLPVTVPKSIANNTKKTLNQFKEAREVYGHESTIIRNDKDFDNKNYKAIDKRISKLSSGVPNNVLTNNDLYSKTEIIEKGSLPEYNITPNDTQESQNDTQAQQNKKVSKKKKKKKH